MSPIVKETARRILLRVAVLVVCAAAVPAWAQQGTVPPGLIGGGADPNQFSVRADQLEGQVRTLTGQVEQLTFQIQELQEQLRRMAEDMEFRFQELGGAPGRQGAAQPQRPVATQNQAAQGNTLGQPLGQPMDGPMVPAQTETSGTQDLAANGSQNLGAPPQDLGTLTGNAPLSILPPGQELNNQGVTQPGAAPQSSGTVALAVPADPQTSYDVAYAYVLQKDYDAAEQAFQEFLQLYPQHSLAGNAQYWLGESYYERKLYREAADTFLTGYQNYQSSPKGAETLVKLAMSLNALGQKEAACASLDEVGRSYPKATKTVRDQVSRERKRAGC